MTEEEAFEAAVDDVPRMEVVVLGRKLGTASGWDRIDDEVLHFYDFQPSDNVRLPVGDLTVDFEHGVLEVTEFDGPIPPEGATGTVVYRDDILVVVGMMPQTTEFERVL